jgi:hypothetical protein
LGGGEAGEFALALALVVRWLGGGVGRFFCHCCGCW